MVDKIKKENNHSPNQRSTFQWEDWPPSKLCCWYQIICHTPPNIEWDAKCKIRPTRYYSQIIGFNELWKYMSTYLTKLFLFFVLPTCHPRSMGSGSGHKNHIRCCNHLPKVLNVTMVTSILATTNTYCVWHWSKER